MLNNSKLLAGIATVVAIVSATGVFAADGKGALYGDIRWSLDYADDKTATVGPTYTATDNNSFWGVKGAMTQGGITAFGAYERFLDADENVSVDIVRQAYAGLKCDVLGTLKYGEFESDYYQAGRKVDLFYNTTVAGIGGVSAGRLLLGAGNSHGQSFLNGNGNPGVIGGGIFNNQVAYTSPSFFGVTVNAAAIIDEGVTSGVPTQDHDYALGAEFNQGGISFGVQAIDANSGNLGLGPDEDAVRVYGGFSAKNFGAHASAERLDFNNNGGADDQYYYASGWFGILPGTRLAASVGSENETGAEGDSVTLGVFHDVIENFTTWVAARRFDGKNQQGGIVNDVVTIGASYKFDMGFGR